jgi:AraC-like DNA-binding protein
MWTNEEINRLKSQHGHGWSVEESADILERSPLDVRNKLISLGLKPIEETTKIPASISAPEKTFKKRMHKITDNIKINVIALRDNEYTLHDIARTTGISLTSVKRILKESGRTNPPKIQAAKPNDTKPAENWLIGQLDSISNLLKNVNDVKEIGYALGRLDMLLIVMKEDERRHNVR